MDALKIEAISRPATDMLGMLMAGVPHIVAAGLILVITWLVARFACQLLASLLAALGFDTLPARIGLAQAFEKTSASHLCGPRGDVLRHAVRHGGSRLPAGLLARSAMW